MDKGKMKRKVLALTVCVLWVFSGQGHAAYSWDYGRFLPAPWIKERGRLPSEERIASLDQGPYGIPLGGDLESLSAWLEEAGVVVENPEQEQVGEEARKILLEHLVPTGRKAERLQRQEAVKAYSLAQIRDLLLKLGRGEPVPFQFSPFDLDALLVKISDIDIRPSFRFFNTAYSLLETLDCGSIPQASRDIRSACGKLELRSWQVVVRPANDSAMKKEGIHQIHIRLYQDEDQIFRVYSCLLTGHAVSRLALLDTIGLLSRKYGEYQILSTQQLGRQEAVLKMSSRGGQFPTCLFWGKNLLAFVVGTYDPKKGRLDVASERYQLLYADQAVTERFMANLEGVIAQAPLEEINSRERDRRRQETSF